MLWEDLDLELMKRVKELNLRSAYNMIAQSMVNNFLYSIRHLFIDAENDKNYTNPDKIKEGLKENSKENVV